MVSALEWSHRSQRCAPLLITSSSDDSNSFNPFTQAFRTRCFEVPPPKPLYVLRRDPGLELVVLLRTNYDVLSDCIAETIAGGARLWDSPRH